MAGIEDGNGNAMQPVSLTPSDWHDIWALLRCSSCGTVLYSEIYECPARHLICGNCYNDLRQCKTCHHELRKCPCSIRSRRDLHVPIDMSNLILKKLVAMLPLPCANKPFGCQTIIKGSDMEQHKKNCVHYSLECPYVTDLMCPANTPIGKSNLGRHIHEIHPNHVKTGSMNSEGTVWRIQVSDWNEYCVCFQVEEWGFFLANISKTHYSPSIRIFHIGTVTEATRYKYRILVGKTYFVRDTNSVLPLRSFIGSTVEIRIGASLRNSYGELVNIEIYLENGKQQ